MKKTVIIGNLGQDATIKSTQDGRSFSSFTVAVTEKSGGQEKTTWFNCSGWGERFTGNLVQYLKKGTKIYLEGNYSPRIWQRQDGSHDISHDLMVNHIELLGQQQNQQAPTQQAPAASAQARPANTPAQPVQAPQQNQPPVHSAAPLAEDDDLPF